MDNILIATDFSPASVNAAFYGVKLAKLINAKVILLNVYHEVFAFMESDENTQQLRHESKRKLKHEVGILHQTEAIEITKRSEHGDTGEVILNVANEEGANWIIAGMKGVNRASLAIFGSTALDLKAKSTIPLILVPEDGFFAVPKTIALASDTNEEMDIHVLDPLQALGKNFNSRLFIVRVIKTGMNEVVERVTRSRTVEGHLKDLHPAFEFLNDDDVARGMNKFIREHDVDVVAMVSKEHTLFERIFVKSNIEQMMIQTHVPLIILPAKPHNHNYRLSKSLVNTQTNLL